MANVGNDVDFEVEEIAEEKLPAFHERLSSISKSVTRLLHNHQTEVQKTMDLTGNVKQGMLPASPSQAKKKRFLDVQVGITFCAPRPKRSSF